MQCLARTSLLKTLQEQEQEQEGSIEGSIEDGLDLHGGDVSSLKPSSETVRRLLLASLLSVLSPSPSSAPILSLLSHLQTLHPLSVSSSSTQQDSLEVLTYLLSHVPNHPFSLSQTESLTCLVCSHTRPKGSTPSPPPDVQISLPLPYPSPSASSGIKSYLSPSHVPSVTCDVCGLKELQLKANVIKPPEGTLVLHFLGPGGGFEDLVRLAGRVYTLCGVLVHKSIWGGGGGHYVARFKEGGEWWEADDRRIRKGREGEGREVVGFYNRII
ncbi:hypothetical protein TrCOL_g11419 [Triparma columacea]|uniref:USP domain-containing protein n=1 Tax=Triparma columacea TaxID=722753 RepID=A0A9W7LFJ6_9STRA|nr:hypothetical protein TrCOL_g11419 [Triparma columacea]